jgi:hypothetical protein
MPSSSTSVLDHSVLITDSAVYEEYLTLTPIEQVPGSHDFWLRSRLDSARDPQALQTRHRLALDTAAIERLHRFLGQYLEQARNLQKEASPTN